MNGSTLMIVAIALSIAGLMMGKIGSILISVGQWLQDGCSLTIAGISSSQMAVWLLDG